MGAGTSAEEFFLKSINVESIFEFVERTDYLFLYSIKECVEKSDCHEGVYLSEVAEYMKLSIPETSKMVKSLENKGKLYVENSVDNVDNYLFTSEFPIESTFPAPIVINRSPLIQLFNKNFSMSSKDS